MPQLSTLTIVSALSVKILNGIAAKFPIRAGKSAGRIWATGFRALTRVLCCVIRGRVPRVQPKPCVIVPAANHLSR